jgi:hypothetical protein
LSIENKLEQLKILEGLFRTYSLILLTLGAGTGTILYRLPKDKGLLFILDTVLAILLTLSTIGIGLMTIKIWLNIRKLLKEIDNG